MVARLSLGLLACLFAFARPGLAQPARAALISDVKHAPPSPGPDTDVVVTARVASGATKVALKVQAVAPGKYIRKADAEYEKDWTDLPMHDDGKDGDAKAGAQVSLALWYAAGAAGRTGRHAIQTFGGAGYIVDSGVERLYRAVRGLRVYEGTTEIQRVAIARALLDE